MKIPSFTKEQIEYLNALYPERCPEKSWTEREIWIAAGARGVVRHLNRLFDEQLDRSIIRK